MTEICASFKYGWQNIRVGEALPSYVGERALLKHFGERAVDYHAIDLTCYKATVTNRGKLSCGWSAYSL